MEPDSLVLGGVTFEVFVNLGPSWPGSDAVYHLAEPLEPVAGRRRRWVRQETICGREVGSRRPFDDEPRRMCQRCSNSLERVLELAGLPEGRDAYNDPAWVEVRAHIDAFEQEMVDLWEDDD
jgi:hypothetical protein